jgi:knotted carbamoyltransferase YgeW
LQWEEPLMGNAGDDIAEIRKSPGELYGRDFLLTWDKSMADLRLIIRTAAVLRKLHYANISCRVFDSGLAVSQFRDNSTRTRFSFASAANLLGLAVQDLDEGKSQLAHGETVRETANMISFLTEVIGIRDDIFLGAGHTYMLEVGKALDEGLREGILPQRPAIINLQCDVDHPTQSMADLLHLEQTFGGLESLRGRKIAMTWAYSPSYGKPLSVPQGILGLLTRFGMHVVLAHPEGYGLIPEVMDRARAQARESGGSFQAVHSMEEAFRSADIVYPKSWAPYGVMQRRTELLRRNDGAGLKALEKECLANNGRFQDWECTEDKMKLTRSGTALYMHCLPADISHVSCARGEVQDSVFERYRAATYREAGWKPYVIAAMILAARLEDPAAALQALAVRRARRVGYGHE